MTKSIAMTPYNLNIVQETLSDIYTEFMKNPTQTKAEQVREFIEMVRSFLILAYSLTDNSFEVVIKLGDIENMNDNLSNVVAEFALYGTDSDTFHPCGVSL